MLRTVGALTAIGLAAIVSPATAADVTAERLLNSPNDPQNWLMVHRDYDNSRHSGLKDINNTKRQGPQAQVHDLDRRDGHRRYATWQGRGDPRWSMTASCTSTTPGVG